MTARTPMAPTRARDLLAVGLLAVVVGNLLTRLFYSTIPELPVGAAVVLGVLAIVEAAGGFVLRGRIERRRGAPPVDPIAAARALLVARASAFVGAAVAGLWVGVLIDTVPRSYAYAVVAAADDSRTAGIGVVCALLLVGAGLWLEHCCRAPDDPDRDSDTGSSSGSDGGSPRR